ncbi:hypothetical protein MTR67_045032 [Solanum verrucosum]|uniref:SKP1 component POZ domain-containing protein n=1 Tax=Solanum verrucosum TaxID=315347 RepID=A0AAF0ZTE1_SOLVR|nr:hypothetical protein MTR67_045032 [Solanum verrucosum]
MAFMSSAILMENECVDARTRSNAPGILCKLDIQKAFDHLNWKFLLETLCKRGFGGRWLRWMKFCINCEILSSNKWLSYRLDALRRNFMWEGNSETKKFHLEYMVDLESVLGSVCIMFLLSAIHCGLLYGMYVPDWQFSVLQSTGSTIYETSQFAPLGPILIFHKNEIDPTVTVSESMPSWCHAAFDHEGIVRDETFLAKTPIVASSHNSPTSKVGAQLVGSPIALVPFAIDAKDSIALIPPLTEFQELNSLAGEVDYLVGKLSESSGTWMGDVELRWRVPQKNECRQRVAGLPRTNQHMEDDCANTTIPIPNVTSKILTKVIEYCKRHVEVPKAEDKTAKEDLKTFDA